MTDNKSAYPATLELAMLSLQSELTNPIKDGTNPHFKSKYATLPEIRNMVTPLLAKFGLYIIQPVQFSEFGAVIDTTIVHAPTGSKIQSSMPLILERQTPQGQGSAITYARRYSLCSLLNIAADEDDEGNAASAPKPVAKPATPQASVQMAEIPYKEYILDIQSAQNLDILKKVYTVAVQAAQDLGDANAKASFTAEKDKRKKALEGGK